MAAIWLTARAEWRQRWRSFVVLALLAGLAGGVTLAAFTGSRRADTSFDRLLERQKYPNVSVELDERPDPELVREAAKLPGVEAAVHRRDARRRSGRQRAGGWPGLDRGGRALRSG